MIRIGEDFSKAIVLNLLPNNALPRNIYQVDMSYVTQYGGNITMHHMSTVSDGKDLDMLFGRDVLEVTFCIQNQGSNPMVHFHYSLRVDRLILLNLALKLLR